MKRGLRFLMGTLAVASLTFAAGCSDDAEPLGERTITVNLSYGGSSNYGPTDATGKAHVNTKTGLVEIDVVGLPMLPDERYEGWLAGGDETPISTGRFNTDDQGLGSSTITLGDISSLTYEKVVLTVEPEPDPSPGPDPRHSIEGLFP